MKLIKTWLFPALTCLIVLGAAVLPARVSLAQDARQFGQVHTETLNADALPSAQFPTLLDRMALYTDQHSSSHPVLSFLDPAYFEDSESNALAQSAQDMLTEAGILPRWIFSEESEPFEDVAASLLLLWDPAEADTFQQPSVFREISWNYYSNKDHQKSMKVIIDAETGLPIHLYVHDTNMSQWLPYDTDHLRTLAEHFFDLLELEIQEIDLDGPKYVPSLNLSYSVAGTGMKFFISRSPTDLSIDPDFNWRYRADSHSSSSAYDG